MKITLDWLTQHDACSDARAEFAEKFPDGAEYVDVQAALHERDRYEWSWWLVDAIYRDLLENPAEVTTQSVGAHVDMSNKIIAASPLAVIETPTTDAEHRSDGRKRHDCLHRHRRSRQSREKRLLRAGMA